MRRIWQWKTWKDLLAPPLKKRKKASERGAVTAALLRSRSFSLSLGVLLRWQMVAAFYLSCFLAPRQDPVHLGEHGPHNHEGSSTIEAHGAPAGSHDVLLTGHEQSVEPNLYCQKKRSTTISARLEILYGHPYMSRHRKMLVSLLSTPMQLGRTLKLCLPDALSTSGAEMQRKGDHS